MAIAPSELQHHAQRRLLRRIMSHDPFQRVTARLGIDFNGDWWRGSEELIFRALRICADCPRKVACRAWLRQAHDRESYPSFCPNQPIIEACRIMDPRAQPLVADDRDPSQMSPSLMEMLDDPMIRQLMEADKVDIDRLRLLLMKVAVSSQSRPH